MRIQVPTKRSLKSKAPVQKTTEPSASHTPTDSTTPLAGESGERVGHFVRSVVAESLQHVRYLSAASAFGQVGSTLGSLSLTPLAIKLATKNAALIGGLAIGGTVAFGAIGSGLGYLWLHNKDSKDETPQKLAGLSDTVAMLGTAMQSTPRFIYPTVSGATAEQTEAIYGALDKLPLHQATASTTIEVVPDLLDTGISGMAQPGSSHTHMLLDESRIDHPVAGPELVLHEQAHAVDYQGGFGLVGAHNWKAGFGKAPFVSNYAGTNRYEDFAESFEHYYADPEGFAADFPEKAAAIEELTHTGLLEGAADRPAIREAGKKVGVALGRVPYMRTGLALAGSLMAPIQSYRGASKLIEGLETGDEHKKLHGKLTLASGLFLGLPGTRSMALATTAASIGVRALEGDERHLEMAHKAASGILTASAGPVGMALAAINGELTANGMKTDSSHGFTASGWRAARPGKKEMLKGTLATVGGTVGGAIAGAALGGALSGNSGAVLGALWGQIAGGAIGLGGYSVHRALQSTDSGDPLALTRQDKKFLKGTIGGAIVGGTAGTIGGSMAGRFLGRAFGLAIGDAATATVASRVGGWAGGLLGAYGSAKLGAGLGSGRLLGMAAPKEGEPKA